MVHIVEIDNAAATQTEHPTRAMVRTFIQTLVPALPLLVLAVPPVIDVILDETTRHGVTLPGWAYSALAGTAVACALVAAIVARVMAIPSVERALRAVGLGAAPSEPEWPSESSASDEVVPLDDQSPVDEPVQQDADEPVTDPGPELQLPTDEPVEPGGELEADSTPPPAGYDPRH